MSEFVTDTGCTIQVKIDVWDDDRTVLSLEIKMIQMDISKLF